MNALLDHLARRRSFEAIAQVFHAPEAMRRLVGSAGLRVARLPSTASLPAQRWERLARRLAGGEAGPDGLLRLVVALAQAAPWEPAFLEALDVATALARDGRLADPAGVLGAVDPAALVAQALAHDDGVAALASSRLPRVPVPVVGPRRLSYEVGDLVGQRYRVIEPGLVASSGLNDVYLAVAQRTGRRVALKVPQRPQRRREDRLLDLLDVPGVVRLLDVLDVDGLRVLVTDWVEGEPFPHGDPPLTWDALAPLVLRILDVLTAVHAGGIVHGDLKPANVRVGAGGVITLIDFGLAAELEFGRGGADGMIPGTPGYLAPELAGGLSDATPASDLFSLGVMIWRALTGAPPWPGRLGPRGPRGVAAPEWPSHAPSLPPAVRDWLLRLVAVDRLQRPANAGLARQELLATQQGVAPDRDELRAITKRTARLRRARTLDAARLASIFVGEDRLLMVRSRAGAALARRAGPTLDDVHDQLLRWLRVGLIALSPAGFRIEPAALVQLESGGYRDDAFASVRDLPPDLPQPYADALFWIALAARDLDEDALTRCAAQAQDPAEPAAQRARWRERVAALERLGLVARDRAGHLQDRTGGAALYLRGLADRRDAHEAVALALAPGDPRRLPHLVQADRMDDALHEALFRARQAMQAGRLHEAVHLLGLATRWSDEHAPGPLTAALAMDYTLLVLQAEDAVLARAAHGLIRRLHDAPAVLDTLLDCAALSIAGGATEALARLRALGRISEHPQLDAWRVALQFLAANRALGTTSPRRVRAEIRRGEREGSRPLQARGWMAEGWHWYRAERPDRAVQAFSRALSFRDHAYERISTLVALGAALIDAGRTGEAAVQLRGARSMARQARDGLFAARAEWHLRRVLYQEARPLEPDLELLAAVETLGDPATVSLVAGTEAAIAWRAGLPTLAQMLARRAIRLAERTGASVNALLLTALTVHLGARISTEALRAVRARAGRLRMPHVELQVLALSASVGLSAASRRRARRLLDRARSSSLAPAARLDLISLDEVEEMLNL